MPGESSAFKRIEDFSARFTARLSDRVIEWRGGRGFLHTAFPRIWDLNFLDLTDASLSAAEIAAEADAVMAPVGCEHRRVQVLDETLGAKLAPGFESLGWETDVHVVMSHQREPNRRVDTSSVEEIGSSAWPGRAEQMRSYAETEDAETLRQMWGLYDLMTEVGRARDFAIVEDGRAVSFALLLSDGSIGQIEDVATLEAYRGRGYSWQVVMRALEVSRAEHELTFLVADDRDWPKDFYSKVGFDPVGRRYYFLKKPQK